MELAETKAGGQGPGTAVITKSRRVAWRRGYTQTEKDPSLTRYTSSGFTIFKC